MCHLKDADASRPTLSIDWDAYLPYLENEDIPEEQKRELIKTLWAIMVGFVDLGFGLHPVQQVCGEQEKALADAIADMVSCDHPKHTQDSQTVIPESAAARKESR